MIKRSKWDQDHYDRIKDDPEYIATGLMIDVNEILYIRMEELGLSQRDLAKRIGRSQPFVWKLLNHGTNMTVKTMVSLAQALELEVLPIKFAPKEKEQAEANSKSDKKHKQQADCV